MNKDLHKYSDAELLSFYRRTRKPDYLIGLYERYMPLVYGVALKYLKNVPDAQDAVMQIYADDVLVYTSETITATQEYKHFKVDIGNARFIKIKITDVYMGWWEEYILGNCYLYN